MNPRLRRLAPDSFERTGLLVLVVVGIVLYVAFVHSIPFLGGGGGHILKADFAQANEVNDATPVRVGGIDVGTVQRLDPGPAHTTIMVMRITQSGLVIHRDASARIAWRTLLGGSMAIDLDPGSPSAPALTGAIPLSATSSQVDWDQLNSTLAAPTNHEFQGMFKGLRATLGDPTGAGRTLHALGSALASIGPAMQALRGEDIGDLTTLVRTGGQTAGALGSDDAALAGLVDGAQRTLAVTASDHVALEQAIQLSPPALTATQSTLTVLDQTLTRLNPLVARLRPAVRVLAPTTTVLRPMLARASRVLDDALPLLGVAPGALRALGGAGASGGPLLRGLTPTITRANTRLLPFLNTRDSDTHLKIYEGIGPTFSDVDDAASQFDGSSWFLHFDAAVGLDSVSLPCDIGFDAQQLARCNAVDEVLGLLSGGAEARMTPGGIPDHISSGLTRERVGLEIRRASTPFAIWLALLVAAISATAVILSKLDLPWPWQNEYTFEVATSSASGVVSGDQVRIAGVVVGHVTGVALDRGQPVVTATMGGQYGPIYRDARLALRPNTPLQDMYLDVVSKGHRAAGALATGSALPVAQTQVAVQISAVVDVFDAAVRPRVRAAIDTLGAALGPEGANFRQGLTALGPFLQAARSLTSVIAQRQTETATLVHNLGLMTSELADRDGQLRTLVAGGSSTLESIASVERPLSALIDQLPPTLRVLPGSFAAVRSAAQQLNPTLTALLPVARALRPALASLRELSPTATSALTALDRPLPGLTALLSAATPLAGHLSGAFSTLTPQAPRLDHVTGAIVPCELAVDRFFNWTQSTTKYYDADGVIPRAAAVAGLGSVGNTAPEKYLTAASSCAGGAPAGGTN